MRNLRIAAVSASFAVLTFCFPAFAQTQADLFNGDILHEVRLYIAPEDYVTFKETNFTCQTQDLEALAGHFVSPLPRIVCHFPVEFHWQFNGSDVTLPQAAIESHGKGSRSNYKPSFKIDFSRYESQNKFLGLRYLVLRANTQEPSGMHERVAMEFFRKMGIRAPREAHARVFLNDQYAGLYTMVEQIDPIFLQRNFGEGDGRLYGYEWVDYWIFDYRGPDSLAYSPLPFKPENNLINLDPQPIVEMVRTINEAPDSEFSSALSQYLDLQSLFKELAAENFIAEQDGIIGDYTLNNFYLYRFMGTLRSIFLPWDKSNSFWAIDLPIFHNFSWNLLTRRALSAAPDLIALYRDNLRQAADVGGGPGGWLEQEITKVSQQIRQAYYEDPLKLCDHHATGYLRPCTNEEFEAEVAYLIQFARQRSAFVRAQLDSGLIPQ